MMSPPVNLEGIPFHHAQQFFPRDTDNIWRMIQFLEGVPQEMPEVIPPSFHMDLWNGDIVQTPSICLLCGFMVLKTWFCGFI